MKKNKFFKLSIRKIRRTIVRSPLQFLAVILITMLSTSLFSGFYSSYLSFNDQINQVYKESNIADIFTTISPSNDSKADKKSMLEAVGNEGSVESRFYESCKLNNFVSYIALSDTYPTINKHYTTDNTNFDDNYFVIDYRYTNFMQFGGESLWYDKETNTYKPVTLSIPITSMMSDILKDSGTDKSPFDSIVKEGRTNIFENNYMNISATPTGKMKHAESIIITDDSYPLFLMSRSFLKNIIKKSLDCFDVSKLPIESERTIAQQRAYDLLTNPDSLFIDKYYKDNQYVTKLNNPNNTKKVMNSINSKFNSNDSSAYIIANIERDNLSSNKVVANDIRQTKLLSLIVPSIFFVVSILVVVTTLSQVIIKERNDIGTLKAIGVSTKQVLIYYMLLVCTIVLTGIILGLIVGPLLLPSIMQAKFTKLYVLGSLKYVFPWFIALILISSALLIVSIVTYILTRKEAKELPIISMRPKAHKVIINSKKTIKKEKNISKISSKMAFRNIRCSIARSTMVIVGVMGSVSLLCAGFGIDDSINYGIEQDVSHFLNCDAMLGFSSGTDKTKKKLEEMYNDKKLTAIEQYCYLPTTVYNDFDSSKNMTTYAYGINTETVDIFKFFNFEGLRIESNEVIITNKVADSIGAKVGEYINFSVLGKSYIGKVSAIFSTFYIQGIFYNGLYGRMPTLGKYGNCAYVRINHDLGNDQSIYDEIKTVDGLTTFMTKSNLFNTFNRMVASLNTITLTIKIFAILLALVVLYNFAILNYRERIRDIATMKVLGFNRKEISLSLVIEIMFLTLIGTLLGLGLGYPFEILILEVNKTSVLEFMYSLKALSIISSFAIAFGSALVLNIFLGYRTKKIKMVESLKSVE